MHSLGRVEILLFSDDLTCMPGRSLPISLRFFPVSGLRPQNRSPAATTWDNLSSRASPTIPRQSPAAAELDTYPTLDAPAHNTPPSPVYQRPAATRPLKDAAWRTAGFSGLCPGSERADASMEPRRRPEYNLDIFADAACVKDVVKAILHTIFFHRYFTSISPLTRDLLDLTLPAIDDVDLETLIEQKTFTLVRAIDSTHQPRGRGQIAVQFFEKKRRKTYFFGKADEDVCWEQWTLDVTLAQPRTETDVLKVRRAMSKSLEKAAHKIIAIVNRDKDHIPPITTTDANPFPYQIVVNPKAASDNEWRPRIGLF
ncbi:hypothetical protein BKA66DRAFT_472345 [Pyrenochaeta sp. MPI-SDFR-AT-0127]|nr:hypothetical protein BKA66DRAFT_472345 [Pyrenochaeta sp. MPI-SDFR-AT-0127]